jgi:hypothetical protein
VRILMTTLVVTLVSVLGLACGACIEVRGGRYLPLAGIACAIAAGLMSFLVIWNVLDEEEVFIKSFVTATLLAIGCSHLSLLSLARLDRRFSWTRISAVVCVVLLCSILLFILWFEPVGGSGLIYRVLGVLGILLASITIVTPVLHKLSTSGDADPIETLDRKIADLKDQLAALETERERRATDFEKIS